MSGHTPREIVRQTVEENGGEYVTTVAEVLALFGRQSLTDLARREMRGALQREGIGSEPAIETLERTDMVRLFLVAPQAEKRTSLAWLHLPSEPGPPSGVARLLRPWEPPPGSLLARLQPRTWKSWLARGVVSILVVVAIAAWQRGQLEAAEPPGAGTCHPSYAPCLDPSASDYDCEGGSGDGPMYTGYVTVKGPDDYGLDRDGDGSGCES